jgi:hypothetical protein
MRTYGTISLSPDRTQWIIARAEPHVSIRLKQLFSSFSGIRHPRPDVA